MAAGIDDIMERASRALAAMDYAGCERLCLAALAAAREAQSFGEYARVLLPLQEARRQRRMIAADGVTRLGTAQLAGPASAWLAELTPGAVVVTPPHGPEAAAALQAAAREAGTSVEVLYAEPDGARWVVRSFAGPAVSASRPAPPAPWRERWIAPGAVAPDPKAGSATPADWWIDASEALGDAAVAAVEADPAAAGTVARVQRLEAMLTAVGDHEVLHQRLAAAGRALGRAPAGGPGSKSP